MFDSTHHSTARKPGRPPGPSEERGDRPWDPSWLRRRDREVLDYLIHHPDTARWKIAQLFDISPPRLSVLTCSKLGLAYLTAHGFAQGMPKDPVPSQRAQA